MPPVVVERPKMTRALWESLKSHIMRERQRKKQELEANAEVERQRKERERQQKQDSMTLSETREQISKLDSHLTELKAEKHQLFLQLKKVLNEDEMRRRQLLNKEASEMMNLNYNSNSGQSQSQAGQLGPNSGQMFLQPLSLARPGLYKGGPIPPQHLQQHGQPTLIPQGGMKRSRSPSPPPHNYRFGPFKPPPHAVHAYPHKPPMGIHFTSQSSQQQHQSHVPSTYSNPSHHAAQQPPALYTYPSSGNQGAPPREEASKQLQGHGIYLQTPQSLSRGYVLHHQMEQHGNPIQSKFTDENPKYYPPPTHPSQMTLLRTTPAGAHINLHPGLNIQPSQGTGSITSGYPIRTTPSVSSYQGRPPSPQIVYAGSGQSRLSFGHGQLASSPHAPQQSVTVARYSIPPGMTRERERDRE